MSAADASAKSRISFGRALAIATIIVGLLDAADGVVAYYFALGYNPFQVLQYIASGVQGTAAFQDGFASVLLGLLLHFLIAFVVVVLYLVASRAFNGLASRPILFGCLYGAMVFLFMNYVVLPHSAVPALGFHLGLFLNGIVAHALFVGLPTALYAARIDRRDI
jgi:hypothetical protein